MLKTKLYKFYNLEIHSTLEKGLNKHTKDIEKNEQ